MDIGVFLPTMTERDRSPGNVVAAARQAEDLGFESVWVVDQLVAGTGTPILDSTVALAAAAAGTGRIRLGFGVLIVPLRPVAWIAKEVASLQHISGDRVILGVGAGGDRHEESWRAVGVPRGERGRRIDEALRVLPDLISGRPARLGLGSDAPQVQLAPGATVPPIIVGGMSEPAMTRAATYGAGWFLLPVPPAEVAKGRTRLAELAATQGRPTPAITATVVAAIEGDPALPDPGSLARAMSDPDGMFGVPSDQIDLMLVRGKPSAVASRLADLASTGAQRVVVTLAAGHWPRQVELLAEAVALLREAG